MENTLKLDQLKPLLKECTLYTGELNIVVEDPESKIQVVLPIENAPILELLNGENSIKEISSILYESHGKVSFHSILTTVKLLGESNLLIGMDHKFENLQDEKSPHEQRPSFMGRTILEFTLVRQIEFKWHHDSVFYLLVFALLGVVGLNHQSFFQLDMSRFLKSPLGYNEALVRLFLVSSLLMTMKSMFQGLLLLASTGKISGLGIKIFPYATSLSVSDNSLFSHPKKSTIISYGTFSALLYVVSFSVLSAIPILRPYRHDIGVLAILLTFMDLNPYRRSDLTKLFYFLYADNQLKNIMPYLKNCSIAGIWKDTGSKVSDEIRYVAYSILAIGWAIGFALFSFDLTMSSLPGLLQQMSSGIPLSKYSAFVVMGIFTFITGHLLIDLFHTIFKNILSPVIVPLMKIGNKKGSTHKKDMTSFDLKDNLKNHMLFNQLSDEAIDFILEKSSVRSTRPGSHLVIQGDSNRDVYFIIEGQVDVSVRESTGRVKQIVKLGPNTVVGEMAIFEKCQRTANVTAAEEVTYLEIPENTFQKLIADGSFDEDVEKLRKRIELSQFVSSANLFRDFPPEVMNLFVEAGDLVLFPKGHSIVEEGEKDKTFYLLIKGEVDIIKNGEVVAELGQGDFFGEVALIANVPRTATVRTKEDCLFLYIEDKKFWAILSENIELAMYIESVGRHRQAEAA